MKSILVVLFSVVILSNVFCKNGNNLQTSLGIESENQYGDDSIAHGIAKNGGFYLPDNAVLLFIIK